METIQSRGVDEYELWITARHCLRPHQRVLIIDDFLDNGSPIAAAVMLVRAAGT